MSVSRDVIAKAYNVPESDVRCSNCVYGKRWISMNYRCYYLCQLWGRQQTIGSEFCSFWRSPGSYLCIGEKPKKEEIVEDNYG